MILNGKKTEIRAGMTVMEFLTEQGYKAGRIAVELNGEILPKSSYEKVVLTEADVMEVVTFMGGG